MDYTGLPQVPKLPKEYLQLVSGAENLGSTALEANQSKRPRLSLSQDDELNTNKLENLKPLDLVVENSSSDDDDEDNSQSGYFDDGGGLFVRKTVDTVSDDQLPSNNILSSISSNKKVTL